MVPPWSTSTNLLVAVDGDGHNNWWFHVTLVQGRPSRDDDLVFLWFNLDHHNLNG
jgi:hypothetical protein